MNDFDTAKRRLLVRTTSRAVREFYALAVNENSLLDRCITFGDFLNNIIYVDDLTLASEGESFVVMLECVRGLKESQDRLNINPNFFSFLKNKEFIFSFLKSLQERVLRSLLFVFLTPMRTMKIILKF